MLFPTVNTHYIQHTHSLFKKKKLVKNLQVK